MDSKTAKLLRIVPPPPRDEDGGDTPHHIDMTFSMQLLREAQVGLTAPLVWSCSEASQAMVDESNGTLELCIQIRRVQPTEMYIDQFRVLSTQWVTCAFLARKKLITFPDSGMYHVRAGIVPCDTPESGLSEAVRTSILRCEIKFTIAELQLSRSKRLVQWLQEQYSMIRFW